MSHSTKKGGPYFVKNCTHKGVSWIFSSFSAVFRRSLVANAHYAACKTQVKKAGKRKSSVKTVAGTQCIDGTWTHVKRACLGVNAKCPDKIEDHVKESQWHSWLGSKCPWHAMGCVLSWARS